MADQVIDRPGGTLDSEVLDLASRIFDMARSGDAATLAAYLDAGAPVNLTNTNGDTLVMLAAYYGHESTQQSRADPVGWRRLQERDHDHRTAARRRCRSAGKLAVRA